MRIIEGMLQELEQEAQTTRRVLERVPEAHLSWKPHAKSMSLGQLSLHIADLPGTIAEVAMSSPFQAPQFVQASATSASELVPTLERSLSKARALLGDLDDAELTETWRLVSGDQQLMAIPRVAVLRSIMLNHWYHHRGQLAVYLRQLNVPVPAIYGASADENPFAAASPTAAASPL